MSKKFWQLSSFIVVYVHSFYCLLSQLQYILYSWVQNWRLEKCKIRQLKYELIILFLIAIFSCVAHSWVMKVKKVTQLYDRLPFFPPSWMREKNRIQVMKKWCIYRMHLYVSDQLCSNGSDIFSICSQNMSSGCSFDGM